MKYPHVIAPPILSLYNEREAIDTLLFIERLYNFDAAVVYVDFSKTKEITAAASLVILAHVHYIQKYKNNLGCFVFDCKKSPIYKSFFIQGKYLLSLKQGVSNNYQRLCELDKLYRIGHINHFALIRKNNLSNINDFLANLKSKIYAHYGNDFDVSELDDLFSGLRTAISEVLLNIKNHAYEDGSEIEQDNSSDFDIYKEKLWWQMFWFSPKANQINFIIYDLGLGIERSYKEFSTLPDVINQNKTPTEIFKEALSEGRSRFIGDGRGYGLFNIVEFAKERKDVSLCIFSGESAYLKRSTEENFHDLNGSKLPGTLVEWDFRLPDWSKFDDR